LTAYLGTTATIQVIIAATMMLTNASLIKSLWRSFASETIAHRRLTFRIRIHAGPRRYGGLKTNSFIRLHKRFENGVSGLSSRITGPQKLF
jgi:hypothetical protein